MSDPAILLSLFVAAVLGAAVGGALTWARLRGPARSYIPETPAAVEPATPDAALPAATLRRASAPALTADVLVVDDSAVARVKLRRLLESQGYSVRLANDGVEALALLEQGRYALMISDLEMPNMDGVTLIHTCLSRPETARMPILAISGHEDLRARFNACHDICGVHRKPWVDDVLTSHVATLVGPRPPHPPHPRDVALQAARAAVVA